MTITVVGLILPAVVSVPSLAADSIARPSVVFTSWASAVAAAFIGQEPAPQLYSTARRAVRHANLARILFAAAVGAALGAWPSGDWGVAAVATSSFLGWALVAGRLLDVSLAWTLPTLHLFAALAIGGTATSEPPAWAWILRPAPSVDDGALSLLLLSCGALVWHADHIWSRMD